MQTFQLLLYIPDSSTFDADTTVSWQLFDRQSALRREGAGQLTSLSSVPPAEHTVIVIPARRVVFIETPLPPVTLAKRDALLRYAIEDKLTIDPATVHAVVLGAATSRNANTHVVAAIDRAWFSNVLRWLREADITPGQAVSSAEMIPAVSGEWGLTFDGAHGLARRADGFAVNFDMENSSQPELGLSLEPPFSLALALKEARDHQLSPSQLTIYTEQPAAAPWVTAWQRALDCPVRVVARPAARMVPASAGNYLAGDFAPRAVRGQWAAMLRPAVALLGAIAVLQVSFVVADAWRLDLRRRTLEREMAQLFKESFPKAQAIVDPPLQMQRNLDSMKRERGISIGDDARTSLSQLTAILQATPAVFPQRVSIREGTVSVEASVPDRQQQQTLKSRATDIPGVAFAVDAGDVVRLSLRVQR